MVNQLVFSSIQQGALCVWRENNVGPALLMVAKHYDSV